MSVHIQSADKPNKHDADRLTFMARGLLSPDASVSIRADQYFLAYHVRSGLRQYHIGARWDDATAEIIAAGLSESKKVAS